MPGHLFYSNSPLLVFITTSIVFMAMAVVGFLIGRRACQHGTNQSQIGAIQSSILGMLALMLGFTFGAASTRYDTRRVLAIDEANAIGTTFMRAQTLPEPYRTNLSKMLRSYVNLRLESVSCFDNTDNLVKIRKDTEKMQHAMWQQAVAAVGEQPSDITGLFEESLNQSIDLYSSRIAWFMARVPNVIMWILAIIAIASLGIVGYGFGLVDQRNWLIMAMLSAIIAVVIVMIVDLDRPEAGPTRISHQSMIDLKNGLSGYEQKSR